MEEKKSSKRKVRTILINIIRLLLALAFLASFYGSHKLVMFFSISGFLLTFLPLILSRIFKIDIPTYFELVFLFFLYGLMYFWKVRGFYSNFELLSFLMSLSASIALGFIGLALMYSFNKTSNT